MTRYACSDGYCGAEDCERCRPGCNEVEPPRVDLSATHEWDAEYREWERVISRTVLTSKRDHRDGKVTAGARYERTFVEVVSDAGKRTTRVYKRVLPAGNTPLTMEIK